MESTKSFSISKKTVMEAYRRVKANKGAAGIDRVSLELFDRDLGRNLYKVWNRMSSGSYFPPPVRQVEIPKAKGGVRRLGVPTVADRVAQMVAKIHVEPLIEPHFHPDSYGYRPGKSAKQAVAVTRKRCWKYDWVVEFDIKGAFDNLDHGLLMKAVRKHVREKWILLYIERWLKAPFQDVEGKVIPRMKGTPQGGVISPILMNVFMHYAFDLWMKRRFPDCPFARYADDGVIHCRSKAEAEEVIGAVEERLEECKLQIHPEKSKIVYCKDSRRRGSYPNIEFTFLGFSFRPRQAVDKYGERFTSFLPGASPQALKRMRQVVRGWHLARQTAGTLEELSERYNPILIGWWNYYGSFYKSELRKVFSPFDRHLAYWARRKYKKLRGHERRSVHWLGHVARRQPSLFIHWQVLGKPAAG
jgi:RNA-directed DNA polymerase